MTGPGSFIALLLSAFTLIGLILFALILIRTFSPNMRQRMDDNAQLPFRMEEDNNGQA